MKYIVLIIFICFIIFLLIYPFKIIVHNESNYLYVNIANFIVFKLNLLGIIDKIQKEGIDNQKNNTKIIKKLKFKKFEIKVRGINFNYRLNGAYYGILCAIAGISKVICESNDIEFNYNFSYLGDESIQFESIVRARAYAVIGAIKSI